MIASASSEASTARLLSRITGRIRPQLIGDDSSLLVSKAVPCLNPMRFWARARALSQWPSTSTSARACSAISRARAKKVIRRRIAAGTAYSAMVDATGLRVGSVRVDGCLATVVGWATGATAVVWFNIAGVVFVIGATSGTLANIAGVSTFQVGSTTGAKAMM